MDKGAKRLAILKINYSDLDYYLSGMTGFELIYKLNHALINSDDLRKSKWRGDYNYFAGHCYVASEVLYHVLGRFWKPMVMRHEGSTHWFLKEPCTGGILDPTVDQFAKTPDYSKAKGCGFLTKQPSKRARKLMSRMGLDIEKYWNVQT